VKWKKGYTMQDTQRRKGTGSILAGLAVLLTTQAAHAAGLGIPLDGFIGTFETFVVGLGLAVGLVGLTGYVGSLMDNPFSADFRGQKMTHTFPHP
jgi:hypothetical protein